LALGDDGKRILPGATKQQFVINASCELEQLTESCASARISISRILQLRLERFSFWAR
jgi:hypothetical protein